VFKLKAFVITSQKQGSAQYWITQILGVNRVLANQSMLPFPMAPAFSDGLRIYLNIIQSNHNQYRHPSNPLRKVMIMIAAMQIRHSWSINKQMVYQGQWRILALYLKMQYPLMFTVLPHLPN
jgi:hypothetical protein